MRTTVEEIPDGDDGTAVVVQRMAELVRAREAHPAVRLAAVDLARTVPPHYLSEQTDAIREFLAQRVRFLSDPVGPELVHDPILLLDEIERAGEAVGDCDDVAVLGASLGQAIGLPARFVVVGFQGPDGPFEHVWAELFDGRRWRELDVTRPANDAAAPAITRTWVVDVSTGEASTMRAYPNEELVAIPNPWPDRGRGQLGALPALVATGAQVVSWTTGLVSALKPFLGSSKDPDRFRMTDEAYKQAVAGNPIALLFLKQRTGEYGIIRIEGIGEVGGWGSPKAKAYARELYDKALAQLPAPIDGEPMPMPLPAGAPLGVGGPSQLAMLALGAGVILALASGSSRRRSR